METFIVINMALCNSNILAIPVLYVDIYFRVHLYLYRQTIFNVGYL